MGASHSFPPFPPPYKGAGEAGHSPGGRLGEAGEAGKQAEVWSGEVLLQALGEAAF